MRPDGNDSVHVNVIIRPFFLSSPPSASETIRIAEIVKFLWGGGNACMYIARLTFTFFRAIYSDIVAGPLSLFTQVKLSGKFFINVNFFLLTSRETRYREYSRSYSLSRSDIYFRDSYRRIKLSLLYSYT